MLQRSAKTEVGDTFNPLVKEMYKILPRVQPDFPVLILVRSGLRCVLWRPGSHSDATCWSDTQPPHPIILPVSHCHQGDET